MKAPLLPDAPPLVGTLAHRDASASVGDSQPDHRQPGDFAARMRTRDLPGR